MRVNHYLGQNEDCSPGGSIVGSSEKLSKEVGGKDQNISDFGEGEGTCNQTHILQKVAASL